MMIKPAAKSIVIDRTFLGNGDFRYVEQAYERLESAAGEYPGFGEWFSRKVIPGLFTGERIFVLKIIAGEIAAAAVLKNDVREKKICTLWVNQYCQGFGLGNELFNHSFELLQTDRPLITISSDKIEQFVSLITKYNFMLCTSLDSYYVPGVRELCFNGTLPAKPVKLVPGHNGLVNPYREKVNLDLRTVPIG